MSKENKLWKQGATVIFRYTLINVFVLGFMVMGAALIGFSKRDIAFFLLLLAVSIWVYTVLSVALSWAFNGGKTEDVTDNAEVSFTLMTANEQREIAEEEAKQTEEVAPSPWSWWLNSDESWIRVKHRCQVGGSHSWTVDADEGGAFNFNQACACGEKAYLTYYMQIEPPTGWFEFETETSTKET